MIAEAGLALLWLAAAMALLQLILVASAMLGKRDALLQAVRPVAVAQGLLAGLAFIALLALFLRSDMSALLVAENSHSMKPWLYKFAGTWGNHEGSMLLWVTVMGMAGGAVALFERALARDTHMATLGAQAMISLGFYAFLLFASNPFARVIPAPADGQGLNPLLQDPGLAFHPPTLYLGYVGLSVGFSFAVGALLTRRVDAAFARAMRPWILAAWILLTLGIAAGSYWAYYELGWGGWWFWDPVENASLMPWLAATALVHSLGVLAARNALRAWTLMLAVLAFSMSMVGTFLVRSGILTSVHAFAVDPARGTFILALLVLYIGGALVLFGWRIGSVREGEPFDLVSREAMLVVNNLLLTIILCVVLLGTLYPLLAEAMGAKVSVGAPYFNRIAGPFALLLMVAMVVGPLVRWRREHAGAAARRVAIPALAGLIALCLVLMLTRDVPVLPIAGLAVAAMAAAGSIAPLWGRKLGRTPLFTWGMVVAHLGCAVSLAGMAADSAFTVERLAAIRVGEATDAAGWRLRLVDIVPKAGDNWSALEAQLEVSRPGSAPFTIRPQARFFAQPPTPTTEAALSTRWNGQLYVVLGQEAAGGRWQFRIWWKPFVTLIWYGGVMIALGGLLALIGHERRGWRLRWRRTATA